MGYLVAILSIKSKLFSPIDDNECGQYGHCEGHDIENQIPGYQ